MTMNITEIENRLWGAADQLWANSGLAPREFSRPVLGLLFLRYVEAKFVVTERELLAQKKEGARSKIGKLNFQAAGALWLPEQARFSYLLQLAEGEDTGKHVNEAMRQIEAENEALKDVLPKIYQRVGNSVLVELLKLFNSIPLDIEGDAFGKIYEYFLGKFSMTEGQKGGEFYTPTSLVNLIAEVIEPFHGLLYDPACGGGGMFVQSAGFLERRKKEPQRELSIFGMEKVEDTVRMCRMNLAIHGLEGDVVMGNSYYDDPHKAAGRFDFVMANPPFNVSAVDKEKLKDDKARFPFGMPRNDNANYLWIQLFYSSLNARGRAGFVMANSASDARQSEQDVRRELIEAGVVDVMIAIGSNFFYTVTLPCTLWFLDNGKKDLTTNPAKSSGAGDTKSTKGKGIRSKDTVLFIDARNIFKQIDRAHREFSEAQIGLIAALTRLYRGEELNGFTFNASDYPQFAPAQIDILHSVMKTRTYADIAGLCKVATRDEIIAQGYSLNPGRYVGVTEKDNGSDAEFAVQLEELNEELEALNVQAHELEERIAKNVVSLLE